MKVEAVLFDFDGTLVDSMGSILKAINRVLANHGLNHLDAETLGEMAGRPLMEVLRRIAPDADLSKAEEYEMEFREFYLNANQTENCLFPKVKEMLSILRAKSIRLGIVSTTTQTLLGRELSRLELREQFEVVIGRESVRNHKPSPEAIRKALGLLRLKAEQCVFVGDSPLDIKAGKAAGMRTIAVATGLSKKERLEKENPSMIIDRVDELPKVLGLI